MRRSTRLREVLLLHSITTEGRGVPVKKHHRVKLWDALRKSKRSLLIRAGVLLAAIVAVCVVVLIMHETYGVDRIIELAVTSLGEGIEKAFEEA